MQDLSFIGADNMGSLSEILFAPSTNINTITPPVAGSNIIAVGPAFASGKDWFKGYATEGTAGLRIQSSKEAGTDIFLHTVSGFVPGHSSALMANLLEISKHRHIVRATDAEGNTHQLGNLKNRCTFSWQFNTGQQPTQRKGYSYQFTWKAKAPAPFIDDGSGSGSI